MVSGEFDNIGRLCMVPDRDTRPLRGSPSSFVDRKMFDLHVHVAGYATSLCSPPTRSRAMFMRLAKGTILSSAFQMCTMIHDYSY